jgi:hypothetical protein
MGEPPGPAERIGSMETRSVERGEIVYLAAEVRAGGRIHEIGARAEVRAVLGAELELALGGSDPETARCPAHHVVRARERRTRTPAPGRSWAVRLRPA